MGFYGYIAGAGLLALLVAGALGYHYKTVGGLQSELTATKQQLAQREIDIARLGDALVRQNQATMQAKSDADAAEQRANLAAQEIIERATRDRRQILTSPGSGPDVMNLWFAQQFSP